MGRSDRKGFALLTIILILAVLALAGTSIINALTIDQRLLGAARRSFDARATADGALNEVVNDAELERAYLPDYNDLRRQYIPSANSPYNRAATANSPERSYTATVELIRNVALFESGVDTIRAFVYEVRVESTIGNGDAFEEARGEVYKLFAVQAGTVMPNMHAR